MGRISFCCGTVKTFILMLGFLTYFMSENLTCCEKQKCLDKYDIMEILYTHYDFNYPKFLEIDFTQINIDISKMSEDEKYWYLRGKIDILNDLFYAVQ